MLTGAGALLGLLAGAPPAPAQDVRPGKEVYTCVDKSGRRLTSDRPIAECIDREQRILDPTGTERRRIGPTLTEHERAVLEDKRRREAQERARVADERRRDRALLARYPDQAAHDAERAQALARIEQISAVARQRLVDLVGDRKRLAAELEFYQGDLSRAPAKLQRQAAEIDEGTREQQRFLSAQEQERKRVDQRFDAELAQLRQLWAAQRAAAEQWAPPPASSRP